MKDVPTAQSILLSCGLFYGHVDNPSKAKWLAGGLWFPDAVRTEPLDAVAQAAWAVCLQEGLLVQLWITRYAVIAKVVDPANRARLVTIVDHPDASGWLLDRLGLYISRDAPNTAEAPVVTTSLMHPISDDLVLPMRLTLERSGDGYERVSVRYNYIFPPTTILSETWLDRIADILEERGRLLVIGPSGGGKTTALQAILAFLVRRNPGIPLTFLGRFPETIVSPSPVKVVSWRGEGIELPAAPNAITLSQGRFTGELLTLQAAADQGVTRTDPALVVVSEVLTPGDVVLMCHCVTTGTGYASTVHARAVVQGRPWVERLRALVPDLHEAFMAAEAVVSVSDRRVLGIYVDGEWQVL